MSNVNALKEVLAWFLKTFGKDVAIAAKETLAHQWARLFKSRNILVLGPRQCGKSSLILHLQHGRPFQINKKGEIITPDPTLLAAVVDKTFSVQRQNWLKIKTDVPGDNQLRDSWRQAVADIHPHGLIYMLDGRSDEVSFRSSVTELATAVFDGCYPSGPRELAALHVFVNFSDQWGGDPKAARGRLRTVRDLLEEELDKRPLFTGIRCDVAATHLSPNAKTWDQTDRALHKFGADIMGC